MTDVELLTDAAKELREDAETVEAFGEPGDGAKFRNMAAAIDRAIVTLRTVKALSESKGGGC